MNNNFIQLSDNILETYGQNSLLPFAILLKKRLSNGKYDLQYNYIFEQLGISSKSSYRQKIKTIFKQMQNDGVIVYDKDLASIKNSELIEVEINMLEGKFTQIEYEDIDKILNYEGNESKYNIFNVFWAIKSHLYYDDTTWTIDYVTIKDMTKIKHNDTIKNITNILTDLELIIKDNLGYRLYWDGEIKNSSYTFANTENKEGLTNEINERKRELENQNIKTIPICNSKNIIEDQDIPANNDNTIQDQDIHEVKNNNTDDNNSFANDKNVSDVSEIENKLGGHKRMTNNVDNDFLEELAKFKEEQIKKNRNNNSSTNNDKVHNNTNTEGNNFSHNSKVQNDDEFLEKVAKFKQSKNNDSKVETVVTPSIKYNF